MKFKSLLIAALLVSPVAKADRAADYRKKLENAYEKNRKKLEKHFPGRRKPKTQPTPVATPKPTPKSQPKPTAIPKPTLAPTKKPTPTPAPTKTPVTTPIPSASPAASVNPATAIRDAWEKFPTATNACKSGLYVSSLRTGFFDFAGRITACFAASLVSPSTVEKVTGKPLFSSGPHKGDSFNLHSGKSFGHYNKAVIQWTLDNGIPAATDSQFKALTMPVYRDYLKINVENYLATIYGLEANPEIFDRLKKKYEDAMASPNGLTSPEYLLYRERKGLPSEASGTLVVSFWVRRKIDGTAPLMKQVLEKVVRTYDPAALEQIKKRASSAPISK